MIGARPLRSLCLAAIAVLLAFCSLGCGTGSGGASGNFKPRTAGTLTVATAQVPDPGFWTGTVAHPTGGFEYELAKALAARFGLGRIKVVEVPFSQLIAGHLHGADMALSDITITDERSEHLDFSESYLQAPPSILVRPGTEVADVNAARALRWAVEGGTTLQSALQASIEPTTHTEVLARQREALMALRSRRVDAVMLDLPVALAYARESPEQYSVAAQLPSEAVLGAALPQGSENVEAVNSAFRAFNSEGLIERLGQTWLHTELQQGGAENVPALRAEQ
jgi:ABC-type amino acid transport substrate-binding protein